MKKFLMTKIFINVALDKMRENANLKFEDTVLKEKYDNYMSQYK